MSAETKFVRTAGGTILKMDVPTNPHALDRWNAKFAAGELAEVTTPVKEVTTGDEKHGFETSYVLDVKPVEETVEPVLRANLMMTHDELLAVAGELGLTVPHDTADEALVALINDADAAAAAQAIADAAVAPAKPAKKS